jgi:prevent-host-death family protein
LASGRRPLALADGKKRRLGLLAGRFEGQDGSAATTSLSIKKNPPKLAQARIGDGAHMFEIGAFEAKNTLGALLDRVMQGEEIIITRHGKPVARLVPNSGRIDRSQAIAAMERIRARAKSLKIGFDWDAQKADRDAGRP